MARKCFLNFFPFQIEKHSWFVCCYPYLSSRKRSPKLDVQLDWSLVGTKGCKVELGPWFTQATTKATAGGLGVNMNGQGLCQGQSSYLQPSPKKRRSCLHSLTQPMANRLTLKLFEITCVVGKITKTIPFKRLFHGSFGYLDVGYRVAK